MNILPSDLIVENIIYGNIINSKFTIIESFLSELNKKIYIKYNDDNNKKPLIFTYSVENINWKYLPKIWFDIDIYNNRNVTLSFDNINNEYIIDFINMIEKIEKNIVEKVKCNFKRIVKIRSICNFIDNKVYINNIKIKSDYNDRNIINSKIYLKEGNNCNLNKNYENVSKKYFHVIATIHLIGIYIKQYESYIEIFPDLYLDESILYKIKHEKSDNNSLINQQLKIDDNDYDG
jgi:hypothetical protein